MTPDHPQPASIFAEALALTDAAQRREYLERVCAGDAGLREEVDSLLRAHAGAGDFLGKTMQLPETDFVIERTGTMIGRYKLLQKIGEGGFGVVYMAEQTEPLQRKVAVKIIKAGMDTREVVARFEAERQALALMDHPNIAKVLDAGATAAGRPYFVMELVNGIPITDFCDREQLPTAERLQLFMKVCHAVQHAHQKGIIHRDIKPNNVLVTLHDGEPVPKVIDFGIAKALGQKLTEKTLFTAFQHMIGTPAYMSPEQAELSGLDIDTRADIYSLGVLLYELLTGETPFDTSTWREAALDEIRRIIRETEPPKPSTRLARQLVAAGKGGRVTPGVPTSDESPSPGSAPGVTRPTSQSAEEVRDSSRRLLQIKERIHLVRGDLDWIAMKCLEKDRRRRYETPDALASDVARHLKNEPVAAGPPGPVYQFGKFVRRHRVTLLTAASLLIVLVIATVVSISGWVRAREQLWSAYLAQAQASRRTGAAGQRFDTLNAVGKAAAMWPARELRDEAASALALPDLRVAHEWSGNLPDTSLLALDARAARYARARGDGSVSVRSIPDDRELWAFAGRGGSVDWVLRFSPDGRFLVATDYHPTERHLRAWNLETGALVLDTPLAVQTAALDFQPQSAVVVAVDLQGVVHAFDLERGERRTWEGKINNPYALRFRGDGKQIAVSRLGSPGVAIYETDSGRLIAEMPDSAGVRFLDWSADGTRLAAPCSDRSIRVWDVRGIPQLVAVLHGHEDVVTWVRFHPAADLLVSGSWDGTTALWSPNGNHLWGRCPGSMHQAALSSDGRWVGLFAAGSKIQLLELAAAGVYQWLDTSAAGSEAIGDFSPDGRWLAIGGGRGLAVLESETWRTVSEAPVGRIKHLLWTPNNKTLLTVGDSAVSEWSVNADSNGIPRLESPRRLQVSPPFAMCSCSRDGQVIAVARNGVWVEDRRRGESFYLAEWPVCNEVVVSPDGRWVAGRKWGSAELSIWELPERRLVKTLVIYNSRPQFSPAGRWLMIAGDSLLGCWEVGTWKLKQSGSREDYGSHGMPRLTISADSRWAAIESARGVVQVLDFPTLSPVVSLRSLTGSPVSFNPGRSLLLVQSPKGNLGVWKLREMNQELGSMGLNWRDP